MAKGLVRKLALALLLGGGIVPAASARDVFLVGDSIRLGYGPEVRRIMEARGDRVFQPDENCRFAQYTLRGNSEVDRYNAAAKAALKDKVDAFDDLNAFVKTRGIRRVGCRSTLLGLFAFGKQNLI